MTTRSPMVSVVVPVYNNADFLAIAIESVLSQTFEDFELVISDHGSSDSSLSIARQYESDTRVSVHQIPRSDNPVDNWMAVAARARGAYLKLLCGDDYLAPDCLEVQVTAALEHAAVLVAGRRHVVDRDGRVLVANWGLPRMARPLPGLHALRHAVRLGTNPFGEPACVLIERSVFVEVGGWDPEQQYLVDLEAYSRVLARGDFVGLDAVVAAFRVSKDQWSVELVGQQRGQMTRFLHDIRARHPHVIGRFDVGRGFARSAALSVARRVVYWRAGVAPGPKKAPRFDLLDAQCVEKLG